MREYVEQIIREVSAFDGVTSDPHRFGGVEFNLGKVEIGHIHANGMVDIPFTRRTREQLVAERESQPHHLLSDSGWITFYARGSGDVAQAVRLFRLSYLQKRRRRAGSDGTDYEAQLAALGFSAAILDTVRPRSAEGHDTDDAPVDETTPEA